MRIVLKLLFFMLLAVGLFGIEYWLLHVYQPVHLSLMPVVDPLHAHLAYAGAVLFLGLVLFWSELEYFRLRR